MKKPLARAPASLQRVLLRLQKYDFQLSYKSGCKMVLAGALLRASMKDADPEISDEILAAQIHMIYSNNEVTGTNLEEIRRSTADLVLPKKLRSEMLKQLHFPHMGIEKTKLRATESMFCATFASKIKEKKKTNQ